MYHGWYQVAFTREIVDDITSVKVGEWPIALVRGPDGIVAYDAVCPHRGANLAFGGQLDGDVIICPFHGRRVVLGCDTGSEYCVRKYRTLDLGGSLFVLLSERYENGFVDFVRKLSGSHCFVPGFTMTTSISPDYVIENVFDTDHFKVVHGINRRPELRVNRRQHGELIVESVFHTNRPNPWQVEIADETGVQTRFVAHVFSPTLVASELGPEDRPNVVFTGAMPTDNGQSIIYVSVAVPLTEDGQTPSLDTIRYLLRDSHRAFDQDKVIWDNLYTHCSPHYDASDRPVLEYREFCHQFLEGERL